MTDLRLSPAVARGALGAAVCPSEPLPPALEPTAPSTPVCTLLDGYETPTDVLAGYLADALVRVYVNAALRGDTAILVGGVPQANAQQTGIASARERREGDQRHSRGSGTRRIPRKRQPLGER